MDFPQFEEMYKAYVKVQKSSKCNMIDGTCVVNEIIEDGRFDLVLPLIRETSSGRFRVNSKAYAQFLKEVSNVMSVASKLENS